MEKENLIIGCRMAISNALRQFRTVVDPVNRVYMIRESLLGIFSWGNYEPLPKLDYVLVFKTSFQGCEACSLDEYDKLFYQVSLVYKKRRRIIVQETKDLNEAIETGRLLSRQLHLNLKKVWNGKKIGWETLKQKDYLQ